MAFFRSSRRVAHTARLRPKRLTLSAPAASNAGGEGMRKPARDRATPSEPTLKHVEGDRAPALPERDSVERELGRGGMGRVFAARDEKLFFFQAEDGIRDLTVTGVQTCALPI